MNKKVSALIFGGLLPVLAFTLIEEYYGVIQGLIAAMVFGLGEIIWEWLKRRQVEKITIVGNSLVLFLGAISLISQDGIWFKLQPAIMEFAFAIILIVSWILKKPLLVMLSEKQESPIHPVIKEKFNGITFRLGLFFLFQGALAVYAALYCSTALWAFLKGVGIFIFMGIYLVIEIWWIKKSLNSPRPHIND